MVGRGPGRLGGRETGDVRGRLEVGGRRAGILLTALGVCLGDLGCGDGHLGGETTCCGEGRGLVVQAP